MRVIRNVRRWLVAVAAAAALLTGGTLAATTGPAAAAGEACWQWGHSNPYRASG